MNGKYVGYVAGGDPLHGSSAGSCAIAWRCANHGWRSACSGCAGATRSTHTRKKFSGTKVICKFYGTRFGRDLDKAAWMARQEYDCLTMLRQYNLVGSPHHVIRPLGLSRDINGVLAVEYYSGEEFSHAIARATQQRDDAHLYWRLKALAYFLATLHNRTANGATVEFDPECRYFDTIVGRLRKARRIGQRDIAELSTLRDRWRQRRRCAGPARSGCTGMRPRRTSCSATAWMSRRSTGAHEARGPDVRRRRVAGELQHAFMRDSGDRHRAEQFIGHFFWEYSSHFPDREKTFESIAARAPYYMALNLLRIARNDYIGQDYGTRLVSQAKRLLQPA